MTYEELDKIVEQLHPLVTETVQALHGKPSAACVMYAEIASPLLAINGVRNRIVAGGALWRVGPEDDACVHHIPELGNVISDGNFSYHVWIEAEDKYVVDYTVQHLAEKLRVMADIDGNTGNCKWHEKFLLRRKDAMTDLFKVIHGDRCDSFYREIPGLIDTMDLAVPIIIAVPDMGDRP